MSDTGRNAGHTARERARAELTREIKEEARRQLAEVGAHGLSLRAVARELGMVSSALYRYYPSRDDLLTALIIDAYNAAGSAAEDAIAAAPAADARARWAAACQAIRAWALAHPHEYALIYGSPVPGYRAPEATIGPAARIPLAFARVLRESKPAARDLGAPSRIPPAGTAQAGTAQAGTALAGTALAGTGLPADSPLASQAAALSAALSESGSPDIPPATLVRAVIAWTQLFGMISFELFGQFVGSFEPADALFTHAVAQLMDVVGLPGSTSVTANGARP